MAGTLQEGESVMLECSDESAMQVRLTAGRTVKLAKMQMPLADLVGLPDGAVFDVSGGIMTRVYDGLMPPISALFGELIGDGAAEAAAGDLAHDNSKITDDNTAQGMSAGEIKRLQHRGLAGAALIAEIAKGSATFVARSAFSKEKWLRSKMRKYMRRFVVRRLTTRTIADLMRHPRVNLNGRPWVLRLDALSQLLTLSNVRAGARVLVVEDTAGQLTGAVAERMGCRGALLTAYGAERGSAPDQVLRWYNLPRPLDHFLLQVPLPELAAGVDGQEVVWAPAPALPGPPLAGADTTPAGRAAFQASLVKRVDCDFHTAAPVAASGGRKRPREGDEEGGADATLPPPAKAARAEEGAAAVPPPAAAPAAPGPLTGKAAKAARRLGVAHAHGWLKGGLDSVLVAAKHDITSTLLATLRWLRPGQPFVAYHWDVAVLSRAYQALQALGVARKLELQELWCRQWQMLPQRTHPHMMMDGASGFLLSGTVVGNAFTQCKPEAAMAADVAAAAAGEAAAAGAGASS